MAAMNRPWTGFGGPPMGNRGAGWSGRQTEKRDCNWTGCSARTGRPTGRGLEDEGLNPVLVGFLTGRVLARPSPNRGKLEAVANQKKGGQELAIGKSIVCDQGALSKKLGEIRKKKIFPNELLVKTSLVPPLRASGGKKAFRDV